MKGDGLFFIDELNQKLYKCTKTGSDFSLIVDDEVTGFATFEDSLVYSTSKGIVKTCDLNGMRQNTLLNTGAAGIAVVNNKLLFADKDRNYGLSIYDLQSQAETVIDDVQARSINSDGQYIYFSNLKDFMSVYRVNLNDGSTIRICGERADFIHIIDNDIYFSNVGREKDWYKMSLNGGQASKISMEGGNQKND